MRHRIYDLIDEMGPKEREYVANLIETAHEKRKQTMTMLYAECGMTRSDTFKPIWADFNTPPQMDPEVGDMSFVEQKIDNMIYDEKLKSENEKEN